MVLVYAWRACGGLLTLGIMVCGWMMLSRESPWVSLSWLLAGHVCYQLARACDLRGDTIYAGRAWLAGKEKEHDAP